MFDDFVQTSSRGAVAYSTDPSARPTGPLIRHVDGFESYASTEPPLPAVATIETGFDAAETREPGNAPIFQLGRVQYAFPAPLACLTVASNVLTMCLYSYPHGAVLPQNLPAPPRLVRIDLEEPERTEEAEVPVAPPPRNRTTLPLDASQVGPHKTFADPSGKHLIISMRSGECLYWTSGWKKARLLPKWKGVIVESIAWNLESRSSSRKGGFSHGRSTTTREILVGTRTGDIYEAVISTFSSGEEDEGDFLDRLARRTAGGAGGGSDVDRVFRHLFSMSERQPISGLFSTFFAAQGNGPSHCQHVAVIATTSTRIYEFVGSLTRDKKDESDSSSLYAKIFEPYKGSLPNLKAELPGQVPHSELRVWTASSNRDPKALVWLSGPGIYHAFLNFANQGVGESVIDRANLLPYPAVILDEQDAARNAVTEVPLGIALTEFHFVLLYAGRVMCISSLDDRVVFDEPLPLKSQETVIGVAVDASKRTYWLYTDSSIFELVVQDEDQDIWKVYLQRGSHDSAMKYVRNSAQRDIVLCAQGDKFFGERRYIEAAQSYAQSYTRTFEEVVLRLLDAKAQDALRYYLVIRLERLKKTDTTQKTMLSTWLVEIYLSKLDQLEDMAAARAASEDVENYLLEQNLIEDKLKQFFFTYRESLDPRTTFSLIARHGRNDVMLHYAHVSGEHHRIVRHWIQEEKWEKAIEVLNRQADVALFYKFSTILMRHAPEITVDAWLRQTELIPRRLIPAMLQHKPAPGRRNEVVRYLQRVIEDQGNSDAAIHNYLLSLLASDQSASTPSDSKNELLRFILDGPTDTFTGMPYYDLDYGLRVCADKQHPEASARMLCKRGFYEEAVELALRHEDVDLACFCAELVGEASTFSAPKTGRIDEESQRRKLWLRIAKHVVEAKQDIKAAMEFLSLNNSESLLSIEDILPFFPDFTVIDAFKDQICLALESYASRIEYLRSEMESATQSAKHIREDIARLSERFVTVEPEEQCGLCGAEVMSRQFYVFPCRHSVHADCLIAETTKRLAPRALRRLLELQGQLSKVTFGLVPALPASFASAVGGGGNLETAARAGTGESLSTSASLSRRAGATAAAAVSGLDRLPEAIINVLSAGVSVGVAGGKRILAPLDPFNEPALSYAAKDMQVKKDTRSTNGHFDTETGAPMHPQSRRTREEAEEVARLRDEMDSILAAACPLCEGSLAELGRSFLASRVSHDAVGLAPQTMAVRQIDDGEGSQATAFNTALQHQRLRIQLDEDEWTL